MYRLNISLFILFAFFGISNSKAQIVQQPLPTWNQTTLMGWFEDAQSFMLNRYQNPQGVVSVRGLFNRITPRMDDESDLDLLNFTFNINEDYLWYRNPNGFRTWIGQTNQVHTSHQTEIRSSVNFAPKHRMIFHVQVHETFRATRTFSTFEYQFAPTENLSMGVNHTITEQKSDLDVGIFVQYGNAQKGQLRLDFKALDYLNNEVFNDMDVALPIIEPMRQYVQNPFYVSAIASTPQIGKFRMEGYFATSTPSNADIGQAINPISTRFVSEESSHIAGLLLESQFNYFVASFFYNREFSTTAHSFAQGSNLNPNLEAKQTRQQIGLFLMGSASDFKWDTKIVRELYSDVQMGTNFITAPEIQSAMNFQQDRYLVNTRLRYQPQLRGPIVGVNHLLDFRDFNSDVNVMSLYSDSFHDYNGRFGSFFGWQFNPRMWIIAGYQFDLDQDFHRLPEGENRDSGYLKMEVRW